MAPGVAFSEANSTEFQIGTNVGPIEVSGTTAFQESQEASSSGSFDPQDISVPLSGVLWKSVVMLKKVYVFKQVIAEFDGANHDYPKGLSASEVNGDAGEALVSSESLQRLLKYGSTLFGPGWWYVDSYYQGTPSVAILKK